MNLPWTLVNLFNETPRRHDCATRPWAIKDSKGAIIARFDMRLDADQAVKCVNEAFMVHTS